MAEVSSQTLHIVARELATELNEARAALEAYGEQQDNVALLRKCNEHLHAVHGALRVSEVYGAALLAEEMGQVMRYLIDNFAEKRHLAEGLDALMRAMVQLPTYLERVLSGGRDMALVLLPLLNDLRAVRGHALLSEGTLLLLNLSSDQQANPAPPSGEQALTVSQWARRLRTRFQLGLLGWIKGERLDQNLEILSRTAEKLEQVATTQPVFQLWWVVGAVLEALRDGGLEGSASIKRLLGQADRDMRRLYEQGENAYAEAPALQLLNNLLYYVARAQSSGPRVAAVRASFRLSELLPVDDNVEQARESLSAPSVKLMKTVAAAIKEDLSRVKDALDIFVRQGGTQVDELAPQLELLKKIADTLGVLGLGDLRDKVQAETTDLQQIVAQRTPANDGMLLRMAATLIKVEDSLDEQLVGMIVPTGDAGGNARKPAGPDDIEFRQVTEAVLRECIVNMARIKEAIALSVEKPRETQVIDQIPQLVRGITAGLLMLGKTRAVEIMEGIDKSLQQFVGVDGMTLPQDAVDRLADAIVAIEYYMETLQAGRADPWYMLDNAETCLQFLRESQPVPRVDTLPDIDDHTRTVVIEPPAGQAHSQTVAAQTIAINEQERTAVLPPSAAKQAAPRAAAPLAPVAPVAKATDREIDPEFLELFIEEAKDEIVRLKQFFPLWDENPADSEALVNVRRSFHTLKGSGRMVGAVLIGEFAWSIENLLNRVISKTLERTPDIMTLLRAGVAAVPELVEHLETGRAPRTDVGKIMAQVHALAGVRTGGPAITSAATPKPVAQASKAAPPAPKAAPAAAPPAAPPQRATAPGTPPSGTQPATTARPAEKKTVAVRMDPDLHEIYAKETAAHLATIRDYIDECTAIAAPYPVTEDLHRACHTLSGTAKTAGARQGIKIAEPLNRYVRKLYDNSVGMPPAGLDALKDAAHAMQSVVENINEDTGFFLMSHERLINRLMDLEHAVDQEISRLAHSLDITSQSLVLDEPVALVGGVAETRSSSDAFAADDFALTTAKNGDTSDIIELEPTDARALEMLDWSFENMPGDAASATPPAPDVPVLTADDANANAATTKTVSFDALLADDDVTLAEKFFADEGPTRTMKKLDGGIPASFDDVEDVVMSASDVEEPEVEEISLETGAAPDEAIEMSDADIVREVGGVRDDLELTQSVEEAAAQARALEAESAGEGESITMSADDAVPLVEDIVEEEIEIESVDIEMSTEPGATESEATEIELSGEEMLEEPVVDGSDAIEIEVPLEATRLPEIPAEALQPEPEPLPVVAAVAPPPEPVIVEEEEDSSADFDPDIAAIFTEEATELLETADSSLSSWIRDRANGALMFELKRVLHTLKGGARMAGIRTMGDLSHELETFMDLVEGGQVKAEQPAFDALQASLDELHHMRDAVASGGRPKTARGLMSRIRALSGLEAMPGTVPAVDAASVALAAPAAFAAVPTLAPESSALQVLEAEDAIEVEFSNEGENLQTDIVPTLTDLVDESVADVPPAAATPRRDGAAEYDVEFGADELGAAAPRAAVRVADAPQTMIADTGLHTALDVAAMAPELPPDVPVPEEPEVPAPILPPGREQQVQERQEFARVDADLLDNLLNNAGEVSIFRSRLEQQVTSIEFNLAELGRTVTRLKDQLRKLELETEAQILHRHEEDRPGHAQFDPLELDRYSVIQQLSRAFAESVSDVGSIEGLLENLTREAQNLLLQQARVVTELQNGLMRTRMVPFQRHVQRLSRLVRQVASDTGKKCEFVTVGASGELDRQVLERMLPPFEHMLRNSVVHGIETPAERAGHGKPESGTIRVGLHREGSEMVIVLEDDGRGIDVNAVRERARERGLLQPGRMLSDEEALQLILEPGFSTASTVTQHAGRGVGMDVVVTEIKKLGGALFTESQPGQGVKFTIRLPFTLAITQALIVRTGEELYALPLPSVEGVARVPRSEVEKHLGEEHPTFNYGGQVYRFMHLGAFIGGGPSELPDADISVPVILIRAGEHSTAVVMDELVGTREMVVKSVGPQVASIRGISGATILGDGRIVIILDMGALVRSEWRGRAALAAQAQADRRTFALVVDDSITVRRVTQRLLERHGMRVMTAKDGVDALSILQEHVPDVILLDIEMPRMDGYEFATHVRADARFSEIPIVMITSRVGEKHRARAIEIGVNDYLGKPYQENQLLDAIEPLVEARRRKVS
jgi:chemosensory pili system protein ChpA (sensor histidine kinase/response regulator)